MKKALLGVAAVVLVALPMIALAAEFRMGDQPGVAAGETITNDVYMAGGSVSSAGIISGDLVIGGGTIVVSGPVGSDAIIAGGNVTILSGVTDDLRAAGGNLVVQGGVGGDAIIGGGQVILGGPGVVGDVAIGGGTVRIDAPVGGSLRIGGGRVYINSAIGGNINIEAESVTLGPKAVVAGTLTYKAAKELIKEEGAVVSGTVAFTPRAASGTTAATAAAILSVWVLGKFFAILASALVLGLVFKRYSKTLVTNAVDQPWQMVGLGLIVLAATPVIAIILMVTLLGIPFGILTMLGYIALLLLTAIVTPIIIGSIVYHYFYDTWAVSWQTIVLGTLLYSLVSMVPFLGWLTYFALTLLALGAIVNTKWSVLREWR